MKTKKEKHFFMRTLLTAAAFVAALTLGACSSRVTGRCDACGKNKKLNEVTITGEAETLGISASGGLDLCDDCLKEIRAQIKDTEKTYGVSISLSAKKKTK